MFSLRPAVIAGTLSRLSTSCRQNARSFSSALPNHNATESASIDLTPPNDNKVNLEAFEVAKRLKPTHNITVCNLHMRGYLPQQLDFYADFAQRAAYHLGMPCTGTVRLPTQTSRWTVIRSPFVHKKSQENFERKTHKRLLQIKDSHPEVVQRWLQYLTMNAPAGIGLRATTWEFEGVQQQQQKKKK